MKLKFTFIAILAMLSSFAVNAANSQQVDVVLPEGVSESTFGANTVTDGTNYYATLQAATEAVVGNADAVLYCKPSADVGSLQHAPVTATLTVYGNGAYVTGGSERDFDLGNTDPSAGKDITADMTLTVKNLDGCGAWGTKATEHTVNLVFENCANMGKVYINGTTGTLNITMNDCAFEGVLKEAVYSNADGAITLNNVAFSNLNKAINLNHKATGTQTVTINGCSFTNCGNDVNADQIPVRVLTSVEGGKSVLNVSNATFSGTPTGGADILLDYGVGVTEATVTGTAANLLPKNKENNAEMVSVTANEGYSNVAPTDVKVATLAELQTALAAENELPIIITETIVIPQGETVVLDLNGKTVTRQDEATNYAINNLGTLTIKDTKGNGSINARGIYNGYGNGGANVSTAKITVVNGTINAKGTNGGGAAIFNYGVADIQGGTFTSVASYAIALQTGSTMTIGENAIITGGINSWQSTLTVNGGTISNDKSGKHVVYAGESTVAINGGTFHNNNSGNATIMASGSTAAVEINGGTFGIKDGRVPGDGNTWTSCLTDTQDSATMTVNGGTFNGGFRVQAGTSMTINGGSFNDVYGSNYNIYGTVTVTGGTFTDDAAKKFAEGKLADGYKLGEDGKVTSSYVAKIGETPYETLQAAIEAVQEGEIITLTSDVNVTTPAYGQNALNHTRAVSFTLDLNGKKLSADTGNSVFRFNITNSGATSNVTLDIKNGTIVSGSNTWCTVMAAGISTDVKAVMNLEDLTIVASKAGDFAVKAWDNATVNAKNVTVNTTNGAGSFYALGGEIVLDNCTVNQKGLHTAPYLSMAFAVSDNGKMTVNSGTYSAEPTAAAEGNNQGTTHGSWVGGVMNSGGTLIINGGTFSNGNFGDDALATAARGLIFGDTNANIEIKGGTFNALKSIFDFQNNLGGTSPVFTIYGGTYSADPSVVTSYGSVTIADGYSVVENANGTFGVEKAAAYVAMIGEQGYETLEAALEATKAMTGDVTVEILDKVTFNQPLIGNYTSINFVGKAENAEMYLDVQGYTTATGKKVSFTDLKLSKSEGGYLANAGFMNVAFGIYDVEEVAYTNCTFENGACASSGKVTFNGCTFKKSWDKYALWVYGNVDVTVQGSTFADYRGIKMYDEGKAGVAALTVKNTDFSAVDNKPAIVLTYGESVVLEGNTYSSTGTFELDLDGKPNGVAVTSDVAPVCVNDNGACGVLVDGKIYTTVAQAAEVATSGSNVKLLHNSAETVELAEGVVLDKNGFEAAGVTVAQPAGLSGNGTETSPYLINNVNDLVLFRNSVNAGETKYSAPGVWVALAADIDLAGENWVGIGSATAEHGFMGNFDGKTFKIKNLTITDPALDSDGYAYAGLFAVTEGTDKNNQNVIKNLTIENVTINTTGHIVSAAIAYPYYTIVDNVTVCGNIAINGGDYTAGVLAYTRRCVNASNLAIVGNTGSFVKGNQVVGGVISDIQMNGGLIADYSNFSAKGIAVSGTEMVGGISGIIATQTLNGAAVENVTLSSGDSRVGTIAGAFGGTSTIFNVTVENVEGATAIVGPTYDGAKAVEARIGDTYYATLEDAFAAAQNGEDVELIAATYEGIVIPAEFTGKLVINGNVVVENANGSAITGENINISGTGTLTAIANGDHAYGIGGDNTKSINIENVHILKVQGGHYGEIGSDTKYYKDAPEGGAAIGSGFNGAVITLTNVEIDEALGGSKAAGIGARYHTGVTININGCAIKKVEGGATAAAIGGSRVSNGATASEAVTINILESTITEAVGGVYAAGIGSGYDTHCQANQPICTINIDGSTINAQGGQYAAGIGTGYHNAGLAGEIKNSEITAVSGDKVYKDTYTSAQDIGFGVADLAREGSNNDSSITYDGTMIALPGTGVAKIGETTYTTLAAAVAAVETEGTITLLRDIDMTEALTIPTGKTIVLDLAGYTVSQTKACTASYAMITNNGSLTITGNGKISFTDTSAGDPSFGWGSYTVRNEGTLVVENGIIEHLGAQDFAKHMICAIFQYSGSTTINGGTISTPNYRSVRLWKGDMTINGGTFDGQLWVQAVDESAKLTINGGTFAPSAKGDASSVFVGNVDSQYKLHKVEFTVTNGTFTTKIGCSNAAELAGEGIKGGKFTEAAKNNTVSALLAEGFVFAGEAVDGYYGIEEKVELPAVEVIDIKSSLTDSDPDLTFALNFKIKDADQLTDEYLEKLFAQYGNWYTDYVLTISGLSQESVTFNANGDADGYLAGQYDAWSENWVSVPFEDVTLDNESSIYIMEYAAKLMGQTGLRFTLQEIAEIVQNFDCGVYFTPEFMAANPGMKVDLQLVVFTEDEQGVKTFYNNGPVASNSFDVANVAAVVSGEDKQSQYYATLAEAVEAAQAGDNIELLADATVEGTLALPAGIKLTSNGHSINGSIRMLGDLTLNGELTITGGLWVGKSGETLTATLSGDKLTANYFMFQRGTYTINADIDAVYGYLSFEGTFQVNSTIHTTGANGEVLYINGNVTLNDGAVLDSDNSVFVNNDNAVLTLKPGSMVDSNVKITASGAKLNIDATGMTAGEYTGITGTVTNSVNGTIAVINNDKLEAEIVDGKVVLVAIPVDPNYIAELEIIDGEFTDYADHAGKTVGTFTYQRASIPTTWTPFYVPFPVPVSQLAEQGFEVAYINGVRRDDPNKNGEFDEDEGFVMEVIYIHGGDNCDASKSEKVLKAHYPYFIRTKGSERKDLEITLENVTLASAEPKSYDCSTFTEKFVITGNTSQIDICSTSDVAIFGVSGGEWSQQTETATLKPFRFYMAMTSRDEYSKPLPTSCSMAIAVRGEELPDGTTLIYDVEADRENDGAIYDLQGRRVLETEKGGIYIKGGKKFIAQ